MFWSVKSRAKTLGIPFDLDISDCQIPEYCAVLGFKLESNVGGKKPKDNSPSLDRLIPALGYVKGNTRVISHRANHIKNNGTIDELRAGGNDSLEKIFSKLTAAEDMSERADSLASALSSNH